jgi:TrmH family RNA methyltransferase
MIISSISNPRIKYIRSLEHRQEREQTGQFFIEGIRIVGEAVQMEAGVETMVYAPDLLRSQFALDLVQTQQERGVLCLEVTPEVFKSLSAKDGPQGIAAVVRQRWERLEGVRLADELCWVALDEAQDPGNIGTILRTGDAVGSAGLILLGNSADPYDPVALRASMGAVLSQRLVKASFAEFVYWKQDYTVIGTSGASATSCRNVMYPRPVVLLMGSERQGLSQQQQAVCDLVVSIPMVGRSDSLNLAVATGVILYELFHQSAAASTHTRLV